MTVRTATENDLETISAYDAHISREELGYSISRNRVFLAEEGGKFLGWMRYNLFWDNTPFLNMLFLLEGQRERGFGRQMMDFWESEMRVLGYRLVMTSTASNECAQHFYTKLGYRAVGSFLPEGEPLELIFSKRLSP